MTFEETLSCLKQSLEDSSLLLEIRDREKFSAIIGEIEKQFDHLTKNDTVYEFDKTKIKEDIIGTYRFLKGVFMENPISKNLGEFVKAYCILICNWNANVLKDAEVEEDMSFIHRIYEGHLRTDELYFFTKCLIEKYSLLKDFALPSVELSKRYLEILDEKNN